MKFFYYWFNTDQQLFVVHFLPLNIQCNSACSGLAAERVISSRNYFHHIASKSWFESLRTIQPLMIVLDHITCFAINRHKLQNKQNYLDKLVGWIVIMFIFKRKKYLTKTLESRTKNYKTILLTSYISRKHNRFSLKTGLKIMFKRCKTIIAIFSYNFKLDLN